jgi:hypothetical protein
MKRFVIFFAVSLFFLINSGCGAMKTKPVVTGGQMEFEMREDKDIGKVYLAPGFNFKGCETLVVLETSTASVLPKKDIDPEEMGIYLKNQLIRHLGETKVFSNVTDDVSVLSTKQGMLSSVFVLESAITEIEPGNRALRGLVGLGAGAAKVQVEIAIKDAINKKILFKSLDRRVDPGGIGLGGLAAAVESKALLTNALATTAIKHSSFIKRIASGGEIEKEEK